MSSPENAPVPPTQFGDYASYAPLVLGRDALGTTLLRGQDALIDAKFKRDDAERVLKYWDDMREFYGIHGEDENSLPLGELAEKYRFSQPSHDHAQSKSDCPIAMERDFANLGTSSIWTDFRTDSLHTDIKTVRAELGEQAAADSQRKAILEQYLDDPSTALPSIFKEMRKGPDGKAINWHDWLTNVATPEQFMNFLQWNSYHTNQLNEDPAIKAEIAQQKEEYKTMLIKFADEGLLKLDAQKLRELYYVKVFVGDVFGTTINDWGGYYTYTPNPNIRYVIVAAGHIKHATKHELNHAILGSFRDRWLGEATTEHIAVAMRRGEMKSVGDLVTEGVYANERLLLSAVMNNGAETIPMSTLLEGYTEQKFPHSTDSFEQAVNRSWGRGALRQIETALQTHESTHRLAGLSERTAQEAALTTVLRDLVSDPKRIFGAEWTRPVRSTQ